MSLDENNSLFRLCIDVKVFLKTTSSALHIQRCPDVMAFLMSTGTAYHFSESSSNSGVQNIYNRDYFTCLLLRRNLHFLKIVVWLCCVVVSMPMVHSLS